MVIFLLFLLFFYLITLQQLYDCELRVYIYDDELLGDGAGGRGVGGDDDDDGDDENGEFDSHVECWLHDFNQSIDSTHESFPCNESMTINTKLRKIRVLNTWTVKLTDATCSSA